MNLSDLEAHAAYYAASDLLRRRRRSGDAVPVPVQQLFGRLERQLFGRHDPAIGEADDAAEHEPDRHQGVIGTHEAALILGIPQWQVRLLAADLDGRQAGRVWLFDRAVVEEYGQARQEL